MQDTKQLRRSMTLAMISVFIALFAVAASTFAWYVYKTGSHTTKVHLAAGTGMSLEISSAYTGPYASAAVLDSFTGVLVPVSTNRVEGGFQKVTAFTNADALHPKGLAAFFGTSNPNDYYRTTLYLRSSMDTDVYISDVGYEDGDAENPISTAIRIAVVPHAPGENREAVGEYIFAINGMRNPQADYNTLTGHEGCVLDCEKTDGTTIPFEPYGASNFCEYDSLAASVELSDESICICSLSGGDDAYGTPVQVDVYIWLEGCDEDCVDNLVDQTLRNISLSFAGVQR